MVECEIRNEKGELLLADGEEMTGFFERMRGMDGMTEVPDSFAMVFRRCGTIQCKFMKVPIDVAHLDGNGVVLAVATVEPGKMGPKVKGCRTCVEMRAGRAAELGVAEGGRLSIIEKPKGKRAGEHTGTRGIEMPGKKR